MITVAEYKIAYDKLFAEYEELHKAFNRQLEQTGKYDRLSVKLQDRVKELEAQVEVLVKWGEGDQQRADKAEARVEELEAEALIISETSMARCNALIRVENKVKELKLENKMLRDKPKAEIYLRTEQSERSGDR